MTALKTKRRRSALKRKIVAEHFLSKSFRLVKKVSVKDVFLTPNARNTRPQAPVSGLSTLNVCLPAVKRISVTLTDCMCQFSAAIAGAIIKDQNLSIACIYVGFEGDVKCLSFISRPQNERKSDKYRERNPLSKASKVLNETSF